MVGATVQANRRSVCSGHRNSTTHAVTRMAVTMTATTRLNGMILSSREEELLLVVFFEADIERLEVGDLERPFPLQWNALLSSVGFRVGLVASALRGPG